ncbi:MAG: ATP-binding protein [Desulfobacterales bacterium]|nr:ATP-binding protein [Desulfobacterales bacterium]
MVDIISTFKTAEPLKLISYDLNDIVKEGYSNHVAIANKKGVAFKTYLDDKGCPSQVDTESLGRAFDRIIQNALEVSSRGQTIHVRSRRKGDHCEVAISDEGQGIKTRGFTIKYSNHSLRLKRIETGLSLSASYKTVRDMGGEIQVQSQYGARRNLHCNYSQGGFRQTHKRSIGAVRRFGLRACIESSEGSRK